MKRILNSSNFWNAVFGCIAMFVISSGGFETEITRDLILYAFILFGGKTASSALKDAIRSNRGVEYDPDTKKHAKL